MVTMNFIYALLYVFFALILIIGIWLVLNYLLNRSGIVVHAQTVSPPIALPEPPAPTPPTPPAKAEPTPPSVTPPTPTIAPTPTQTAPNLQYLPQKSYVQTFAPENGVPSSIPLQAVPQVMPVQSAPQQQSAGGFDMSTIMSVISMVMAGGSGFLGKMGLDKAKTANVGVQAVAQNNVKQATVQQKTLEQLYENMPDKGASITDKPEIKLENVTAVKEEALETAAKA
jgi:hypothetical protein